VAGSTFTEQVLRTIQIINALHDLTTFGCIPVDTVIDSDGDGVQDQDDAFPLIPT
jgi:hypothetical protein